jgi:hypothetical protein
VAKIIGNLTPKDDYTHPVGPEKNFNESVYFNFFDPNQRRGGFLRIGNRANEGYAEMTIIIWNPDGSAYFTYAKPKISNNDRWQAGGLDVEIVEPTDKIRTRYDGQALFLKEPRDMENPSNAFKNNPSQAIEIDLLHTAVGPLYGHVGEPGDGNEFARSHTEQHMRVSGKLKLAGDALEFSGWGLRDHSWGPRFWQSTPSYRWITCNFGNDLGLIITTNGDGKGRGLFQKGQSLEKIEAASIKTEFDSDSGFHKSLEAEMQLENGQIRRLSGKVISYIPLRNRRSGANTRIGEGMTEYRLDDELVGYGLSEYLDQTEPN